MRFFATRKTVLSWARDRASRAATLILAAVFLVSSGCSGLMRNSAPGAEDNGFFGWHFHAPFDTSEVKTVAIFFKSNVFRRDLEKQLTEAVIKEINLRTPYRVVGESRRG